MKAKEIIMREYLNLYNITINNISYFILCAGCSDSAFQTKGRQWGFAAPDRILRPRRSQGLKNIDAFLKYFSKIISALDLTIQHDLSR